MSQTALNTSSALQPQASHAELANAIRALAMDAVEKAKSGHPGMPMGMADVATVLFTQFLKFDPEHPKWPDRDRFILSAGHGSMLLYALLYLTGYDDITIGELKNFRQLGAKTAGHPEYGHAAGIETTTGPLGQGIANAVGMALAERMQASRFGEDLVNHYTYVIAGDGCLMEGISQEAISLAGHLKLGKLIVLWDDNNISIDGKLSLSSSEDQIARFKACGWDVQAIDGHDPKAIADAIRTAQSTATPSMIACKTTIAFGAPTKAGSEKSHGSPLGAEEIAGARKTLNWPYAPFEIPEHILAGWREYGARHALEFASWTDRLNNANDVSRETFERLMEKALPENWNAPLDALKKKWAETAPKMATRKASGEVLNVLAPAIPEMIGGSADLTGSVNTKTDALLPVTPKDFSGRYIYWGIREHGMAAAMNGMALHGDLIPYAGTFLVFTDYCKPAIRLSALMEQRVIYVMTHDSIGLGEDGPTHQPVEHLAMLRAIPNLNVFRPADAIETAECWALAVASQKTPSVLSLTRQDLPTLRREHTEQNLSAFGGYVLSESEGEAQVTLLATGSEVHLAIEAQKVLKQKGIAARVSSLPCWRLLDQQPKKYREKVLGKGTARVAVEAAVAFGWERYIGRTGAFVGMKGFGASAPAEALYEHFGITVDAIVKAAETKL
ncbi:MAG: transketolase [Alphaproteobacteria bacterium]|nr:transketolase [Alphaproteobacteria bacterium]